MKKVPKDTLPIRTELNPPARHKTLEERAAEYDGQLNLDSELDWRGTPAGNEIQ